MEKCETCKFRKEVMRLRKCWMCKDGPHILQRIEFDGFEDNYEAVETVNTFQNPEPW